MYEKKAPGFIESTIIILKKILKYTFCFRTGFLYETVTYYNLMTAASINCKNNAIHCQKSANKVYICRAAKINVLTSAGAYR